MKSLKEFAYIFLIPPLLGFPILGFFNLIGLHSIGVVFWLIAIGIHFAIMDEKR